MRATLAVAFLATIACGVKSDPPLQAVVIDGPVGEDFVALARRSQYPMQVRQLPYEELLRGARGWLQKEQANVRCAPEECPPDLIMLDDPWLPKFASAVAELSGLRIPENAFLPQSIELCRVGEGANLSAVPFLANIQAFSVHTGYIELRPSTWNDVLRRASEVQAKYHVYGYAMRGAYGNAMVTDFLPLLWANGGDITQTETSAPRLAIVEAVKALRLMLNLAQSSSPAYLGFGSHELRSQLGASQAAMGMTWIASAHSLPSGTDLGPLPSLKIKEPGKGVFSTWLLVTPHRLSDVRTNRVKEYLKWLTAGAWPDMKEWRPNGIPPRKEAADKFFKRRELSLFAPDEKGYVKHVQRRPLTEQWLEIEEILSHYLSQANIRALSPEVAMIRAGCMIETSGAWESRLAQCDSIDSAKARAMLNGREARNGGSRVAGISRSAVGTGSK